MARIKWTCRRIFRFPPSCGCGSPISIMAGIWATTFLLGLLHEARVRFLAHFGLKELDIFGLGLIMADSVIVYKSEAFPGEVLKIAVAVVDFNKMAAISSTG